MYLTGVDYLSTLGYQPGIAALAAGALSPFATLVLVLVTLFGALPMYRRVAGESPHGDGSISMLERLLSFWSSKLLVLALIGFVATGFVITITLSAAAAAHLTENPLLKTWFAGREVLVALALIALLGAVFLKGFKEAIGIAVVLVTIYLGLTLIVVGKGVQLVFAQPHVLTDWWAALGNTYANPLTLIGAALLVFPRLALGLSGFETGVVVMPLVQGEASDTEAQPTGRIRNARKLLTSAALIMIVFLLSSSVTTLLIPAKAFQLAGEASGRAPAFFFLAHTQFGETFGTVYDVSTILILWFAGASATAGLLNIVPRSLPRYGMVPDWTSANRPLVLVFISIAFLVTLAFKANVDAQAGAYATGVLALMTSEAVAVTLLAFRQRERALGLMFSLISLIFIYTSIVTVLSQPEGLYIALLFILAVLVVSITSRISRSTELRTERIDLDEPARMMLTQYGGQPLRFIANRLDAGDISEYQLKELDVAYATHLPSGDRLLFLEVQVDDASEFSDVVEVKGVQVGSHQILRARGASVPNALAAFLLHVCDLVGIPPHVYFEWDQDPPVRNALRFLIAGEGDILPLTHEILRQAEPDAKRRPVVHVGGGPLIRSDSLLARCLP
ncbi:amino acid transporter [Deinococcus alpinitundrae]|uniref:amino acid transporter n=1 Tax=Deinococcus alpinitundrae TaxID=468913 RepID=UPI001ED8C840|nr:amino acid transporter [Deinococcus alpinitundrae]